MLEAREHVFDRHGRAQTLPATQPVPVYEVWVEDGEIVLEIR